MFTCMSRVTQRTADQGRPMRAQCESLETRRLLAVVTAGPFGQGDILQLTDADNDVVRYSLTGGGTGELTDTGLVLTGTTARSTLTVSVSKKGGGDGLVTIPGITADGPMKTISAKAGILAGNMTLNTGAEPDPENPDAPGPVDPSTLKGMAITLAQVQGGSINTGGQAISSIKLQDWAAIDGTDQQLVAPYISSLSVSGIKGVPGSGDLGANLVLDGRDSRVVALRSAKVNGTVYGIDAPSGGISSLQAGGIDGIINALYIGTLKTSVRKGEGADTGNASGEIRAVGSAPQNNKPSINTIDLASTEGLTIRASEGNLGTVTIRGNAADTSIYAANGGAKSVRVGGLFSGGRLQTLDGIPTVTFGSMENSNVLVGVNSEFTEAFAGSAAAFENANAKIRTFTVGKNTRGAAVPQVTGTNHLSAAELGSVTIYNMESVDPASLLVYTIDDPTGARSPNTLRYTDNANPANNVSWRYGQAWTPVLEDILTVWPTA